LQKIKVMGRLLQNFGAFDLWQIEESDLTDFTKFVLRINYQHHLGTLPPDEEIEAYVKEDERLHKHSYSYALKTTCGKFFGTINVCLWDGEEELAIEREYKLSVKKLVNSLNVKPYQIWHIGRFAVDRKEVSQNDTLKAYQGLYFKLLLTCAFTHICADPSNVMIAECDRKLHEIVKRLNIFSESLSEGQIILGSEALPIINTGAGLQPFYDKHKHLIRYDIQSKQNLHRRKRTAAYA
jgi:hypothetical protein